MMGLIAHSSASDADDLNSLDRILHKYEIGRKSFGEIDLMLFAKNLSYSR